MIYKIAKKCSENMVYLQASDCIKQGGMAIWAVPLCLIYKIKR